MAMYTELDKTNDAHRCKCIWYTHTQFVGVGTLILAWVLNFLAGLAQPPTEGGQSKNTGKAGAGARSPNDTERNTVTQRTGKKSHIHQMTGVGLELMTFCHGCHNDIPSFLWLHHLLCVFHIIFPSLTFSCSLTILLWGERRCHNGGKGARHSGRWENSIVYMYNKHNYQREKTPLNGWQRLSTPNLQQSYQQTW